MLKHFKLQDKGGRLGVLKDLLSARRKTNTDPYSSGQNDPFPTGG